MMTQATLTIGGRTFQTGEEARTPRGTGRIVGLDPFADTEIGVQFASGEIVWFSFREVNNPPHALVCEACGRDTELLANGIGQCCWGKE